MADAVLALLAPVVVGAGLLRVATEVIRRL
jgi:hypothetical protein